MLINLGAIIAAVGGIFLKRFSVDMPTYTSFFPFAKEILQNKYLYFGGICYVVPIFFWAYLLRDMELSKLQPILSIVYLYTLVLAYFFLDEQISTLKIVGVLLVMGGVSLIGQS